MQNDFQAIKDLVDIADEITQRTGGTLKKTGKTISLSQCPFCGGHECFRIYPDTRSWNCFQCGDNTGGSIIDFVVREKGCTEHEALKELARAHNYELHEPAPEHDSSRETNSPRRLIFEAAANYYAGVLFKTNQSLGYQRKTRGHSDQTLKKFRVGAADGGLLTALQKQNFSMDDILGSGLAVPDKKRGYRDFFLPGLFVYPHTNKTGQVCHFSIKDPRKKLAYQLPNEHRLPGAPFFNMKPFKGNRLAMVERLVLVEGENDLLSVFGKGHCTYVAAVIGQISVDQLKYLVEWVISGPPKELFLCFDNDPAGNKYRDRITEALKRYCYPDKVYQINERLRGRVVRKAKEDDSGTIPEELPKLIRLSLKNLSFDPRFNDIDDYLKAAENPEKEFQSLLDQARPYLKPLTEVLPLVRTMFQGAKINNCGNEIGEVVFDYFNTLGGFFVNGEECRLFYEGKIYEIGNNIAFKSLIYQAAGLNYADNGTKSILEVIRAQAYIKGKHTSTMGWIHTDAVKGTIYYDLRNEMNTIARIQAGKVDLIQNGANEDNVLLESTPRMEPVHYLPEANIQEAMDRFKSILLDNLACSESNKYFIAARVMNTILLEFVTTARGITKFSGDQGAAKSFAARLISYLIMGADCVSQGSVASYRSEATKSPVIIPDNLEKADRTKEVLNFLLLGATGAINQKRDSNTSSGNIYEENKAQIITTSIEPFTESELISRTIDIHFEKEFRNKDFPGETLLKTEIERNRDLILSSFFKIVAFEILPTFSQERAKINKFLNTERQGHAKERLNELFACLYLLCREVVRYIPHSKHTGPEPAMDILDDWLNEQHDLAAATQQDTDDILYRLEILLDECCQLKDEFSEAYGIQSVELTRTIQDKVSKVSILASANELCTAFSIISKQKNIPNPFHKPGVLGSRLSNSKPVLEGAGWQVGIRHTKYAGKHKHLLVKNVEGV
ncbi:CHC2 zinc finger domain-containing protein [Desulfobacter sp.]|uniref:CHC2 zinc finger domain-containing protein n=1 Tax=Desulfobacter sp. TaxID=2294 RepID=UPI003D13CF91